MLVNPIVIDKRCRQMSSFGWSHQCLGATRLSLMLLAVLVLACSYGTSIASFEVRGEEGHDSVIYFSETSWADAVVLAATSVHFAGVNSHG